MAKRPFGVLKYAALHSAIRRSLTHHCGILETDNDFSGSKQRKKQAKAA
jgi:hypothetical protein